MLGLGRVAGAELCTGGGVGSTHSTLSFLACDDLGGKIVGEAELARVIEGLRSQGKRIVFTNGCFEVLHPGHVRYLTEARSQGDALVVGLNADCSVSALKGAGRPVVAELDRAEMLAALEAVDYVALFPETTAERLVSLLRPDVYVKGGDYEGQEPPEAAVVRGYGGRVHLAAYHEGHSTTQFLTRLAARDTSP